MNLEQGMRVRCVNNDGVSLRLKLSSEYEVDCLRRNSFGDFVVMVGVPGHWKAGRFKPVVRVKAPSIHTGRAAVSFEQMVARACKWFDNLTPEQQAEHREAQRQSWARGEAGLAKIGL
jgi:hypothetical protein